MAANGDLSVCVPHPRHVVYVGIQDVDAVSIERRKSKLFVRSSLLRVCVGIVGHFSDAVVLTVYVGQAQL